MNSRILVSGYDKGANSEIAKNLAKNTNALVLAEHEFQKAIENESRIDRYKWLSPLIDMEEFYHQDIIVLWFGSNDKKKIRVQNPDNKRILDYCNELLFMPYSNIKMNTTRTRIYFVDISQKVRLSDSAELINKYLGKEDIATFQATENFIWSFPYTLLELVKS